VKAEEIEHDGLATRVQRQIHPALVPLAALPTPSPSSGTPQARLSALPYQQRVVARERGHDIPVSLFEHGEASDGEIGVASIVMMRLVRIGNSVRAAYPSVFGRSA